MLLFENGELSATKVLAISGWLAFLIVSAYLVYKGNTWGNYETFSTMTAGGGAATQIANKFINSKYNSPLGAPQKDNQDQK